MASARWHEQSSTKELGFRPDIIEHQLSHKVKDLLGGAYNRTSHREAREDDAERGLTTWTQLKSTVGD